MRQTKRKELRTYPSGDRHLQLYGIPTVNADESVSTVRASRIGLRHVRVDIVHRDQLAPACTSIYASQRERIGATVPDESDDSHSVVNSSSSGGTREDTCRAGGEVVCEGGSFRGNGVGELEDKRSMRRDRSREPAVNGEIGSKYVCGRAQRVGATHVSWIVPND